MNDKELEKILSYGSKSGQNPGGEANNRKRILLLEGDGFTRVTLMNSLVRAGFSVDFAPNGRLGLHQLKKNPPDALVVEVNLRGISGVEIVQQARKDPKFGSRPVYVFTFTDLLRRSTRKELTAQNARLFDKVTVSPEELAVIMRAEIIEGKTYVPRTAKKKQSSSGAKGLAEALKEARKQTRRLANSKDAGERVATSNELRENVYSILSSATVSGMQNTARHAKALVGYLDELGEKPGELAKSTLDTVVRSVEVLAGLARAKAEKAGNLSNYTVVVVDQAPASSKAIGEVFQSAGLAATTFEDPAQALAYLADKPADLIVSNLPPEKQREFELTRIRELEMHRETPIIVVPATKAPETSGDAADLSAPTASDNEASFPYDPTVVEPERGSHTELLVKALTVLQEPVAAEAAVTDDTDAESNDPSADTEAEGLAELDSGSLSTEATLEGEASAGYDAGFATGDNPARAEAETAPLDPLQTEGAKNPSRKKRKRTIMFIEDDPLLLKIYRRELKIEGFRVEAAEDGLAAIEMLPAVRPDLVVLDIMLPKLHGLEVLKFIRADVTLKDTPVIVLSNTYMEGLARKALEAGANKGLLKIHCTPARLVEEISGLLGTGPEPLPTAAETSQLEPETAFVAYGENGQTAVWTRKDNCLRDAPTEIAKIRQACVTYVKTISSPEGPENLGGLFRRVRFFAARMSVNGFTKLAEVATAFEALLFEIVYKKIEPTSSILQTMAQVVDCLGQLHDKGDIAYIEPRRQSRVLVVDDDAVCLATTVSALKHARVEAVGTQNPLECFNILENECFDLIVLDVHMPNLNGFQLCEKLRKIPQYETCPVIFLTVASELNSRARGVLVGASDFLNKPVTPVELCLKVTLHLAKSAAKAAQSKTPPAAAGTSGEAPEMAPEVAEPSPAETAADRPRFQVGAEAPVSAPDPTTPAGPVQWVVEGSSREPAETPAASACAVTEVQSASVSGRELTPAAFAPGESRRPQEEPGEAAPQPTEAQPENDQDKLARLERERALLVSRVYNAENELHIERARIKRREKSISALQEKLDALQSQPAQPALTEDEKRQQNEAVQQAEAAQKQAQERCAQLEAELAELKRAREETDRRVGEEQAKAAELLKQTQDLESRLNERSAELERARVELTKASEEAGSRQGERQQHADAVAQAEAAQKQAQERCAQLEAELAELKRAREELDSRVAREQSDAAELRRRTEELESRLSNQSADLQRTQAELEKALRESGERTTEEIQKLSETARQAAEARQEALDRCARLEAELAELNQARQTLDVKVAEESGKASGLQKRGEELEALLGERTAALEQAKAELEKQTTERTQAEAELWRELETADAAQKAAQERCAQLEKELSELRQAREHLGAEAATTRDALTAQAADLQRRAQELQTALDGRSEELARVREDLARQAEEAKKAATGLRQELTAATEFQTQAQARCAQLERELSELRKERETLTAELGQVRETLAGESDAARRNAAQAAELRQRSEELETRLREKTAELEQSTRVLEVNVRERGELETGLKQELERARAAQHETLARCTRLERELAELQLAKEELSAKAESERHDATQMRKRSEELEASLKSRSDELDGAKTELARQGKEWTKAEAGLRHQLEAASKAQKQAQVRCANLEKELSELALAREALSVEAANGKEQVTQFFRRSQDLESLLTQRSVELEQAKACLEKEAKERAEAQTRLVRELESAGAAQKQTQSRCKQLEKELGELHEARETLNAKIAGDQRRVAELVKRAQELQTRLEEQEAELKLAQTNLKAQTEARAAAETDLRRQLDQSLAAQQQSRERCAALETELAGLQTALQSARTELSAEQQQSSQLRGRTQELENRLAERVADLKRVKAEHQKHSREQAQAQSALRKQLDSARAEIDQAQSRCVQLETSVSSADQARQDLERRLAEDRQHAAKLREHALDLENRLEGQSAEMTQLKGTLETQANDHAQALTQFREKLDSANSAHQQTREQCKQLQGELLAGRITRETLETGLRARQAEAEQFRQKAGELESRLAAQAEEFNQSRADLERQLAERAEAAAALRQQVEAGTAALNQATARAGQLEQEIANLSAARLALNAQLAAEQAKLAEARQRATELEALLESRAAEIDRLNLRLSEQSAARAQAEAALQQELEAARAEQQQAYGRCARLEQDLEESRNALEALEQRARRSESQVAELRQQNSQLEKSSHQAEVAHRGQVAELEERVRQGIVSLTRATSDVETERAGRESAEQRSQSLAVRLEDLHAELGRQLQTGRSQQETIARLESQTRQQQGDLTRVVSELGQEKVEKQLAQAEWRKAAELGEQFRKQTVVLGEANQALQAARENLQALLEQNLAALRETETRLQAETATRLQVTDDRDTAQRNFQEQQLLAQRQTARLNEALAGLTELEARCQNEQAERQRLARELEAAVRNAQAQTQTVQRQEEQIRESFGALAELQGRLQNETAENRRISNALVMAQQEARCQADLRQVESSRLEAHLQQQQVERTRVETNLVRLRHATIKAARTARTVRLGMRQQVRQPIEELSRNARTLVAQGLNAEQKTLVESILQNVLLLENALHHPAQPACAPRNGEASVKA